jgi:uncharacterized protein YbjT (DUF2867 family)
MRVLIAGGTGTAGSALARHAIEQGDEVLVLSRRPGTLAGATVAVGDLVTGAGLRQALDGVEVVIDCSNLQSRSRRKVEQFFVTGTRNLVTAAAAAGAGHLVLLSIVGIDRVPLGYYRAKLAQEAALSDVAQQAGLPCTIARVTQFHEFASQLVSRSRVGRWALVPRMRVQPVELTEVAQHLLAIARAARPNGPATVNRAADLAGPREEGLATMATRLVATRGDRLKVVPIPLPGRAGRAAKAGGLLPAAGSLIGQRSFDQWLVEQ